MRFFRATRLQRILIFLLLVFLIAGPFGFIEQQENKKEELLISSPHSLATLSCQLRQFEIKYGFDAVHVSVLPIITKILSVDYLAGTAFKFILAERLTNPDRAPPHLMALL